MSDFPIPDPKSDARIPSPCSPSSSLPVLGKDSPSPPWMEILPQIVWMADPSGAMTYLNPQWTEFTGIEVAPSLGLGFWHGIHPDDRDRLRQQWQTSVTQGLPYEAEFRLHHRSGAYRWMVGRARSQRHESGKIQGWIGTYTDIDELTQTRLHLHESEQRFRAIFNQTFQFIGLLHPNGILIEANQTALDFADITLDQVIGRPFWDCYWWRISPETQTQLQAAIDQAAQGEFIRYEVDVLGAQNTVITIDFSIKPIWDDQGQVILLLPEGRDITKRKQAEAEIQRLNAKLEQRVAERTAELETSNRQKEELLHRERRARAEAEAATAEIQRYAEQLTLALDAAKLGAWDWDMETDQIFWTQHHENILGYEPGQPERTYQEWADRVHPDDLPEVEAAIQSARQEHQLFSCHYRVVLPDASIRWVDAFGRFYYDSNGLPIRMVGMLSDITDRKLAEQALQEGEERFRTTFEQAAVGIAHVALRGRWLRVNQTLCDIVGYSREELLQQCFQDITYPEDLQADYAHIEKLLTGEVENFSLEKRYVRKDQALIWVEVTVSLRRTLELSHSTSLGSPQYFIAVVEDISDRKQHEAERYQAELALQQRANELTVMNRRLTQTTTLLQRRNQELDEFAYAASHDLKAPLRAIANLSEWIEEDLGEQCSDELRQQLRLLRGRVKRMESLINGLLDYSRVGRMKTEAVLISLTDLLHDVLDSLAPPITFTIQIDPMPTITTKILPLRQVFANLISNAITHHDRPDGQIYIGVQEQGDLLEFAVRDDGPGIPPEHHERIFMIFQTLSTQSRSENTGVGLSIVKKIVESEGGTIRLVSAPHQGTTFYFTWNKQVLPSIADQTPGS